MASIHIERFVFFKSENQQGFGLSFILHGGATFLNCTFSVSAYMSLLIKQHHNEPSANQMTPNSTLWHILIPRVRFLMSVFKSDQFSVHVWQVAAKVSFTQCVMEPDFLLPGVDGLNDTSSAFLFLHIDKSSVSRCTIYFDHIGNTQLLTSMIHVEITDSRLDQTTLLQYFPAGIITLSIHRCILDDACNIAYFQNICYVKITESTFFYQ